MHVLSKWRLVLWFWVAQAVFVAMLIPLGVSQVSTVNGARGRPWGEFESVEFLRMLVDWRVWLTIMITTATLMTLQTVIVWPVRKPVPRRAKGWPLRLSIGAGALVGTAMASGIVWGLATVLTILDPFPSSEAWNVLWVGMWVWIGGSYIVGAALLHRFCSRGLKRGERQETLLARIAATLFTGTLVEMAAIMPIDVMYRRKHDCYCAAGTFWGYMALLAAGLVTLGPAILLPVLSRRRKRWYASHCDCCGYDMTGLSGVERLIDRCPECGAGWRAEEQAAG